MAYSYLKASYLPSFIILYKSDKDLSIWKHFFLLLFVFLRLEGSATNSLWYLIVIFRTNI